MSDENFEIGLAQLRLAVSRLLAEGIDPDTIKGEIDTLAEELEEQPSEDV